MSKPHLVVCLLFALAVTQLAISDRLIADEFDLDSAANVPVRFNGRVTTLGEVASNYARLIGSDTSFVDEHGSTFSAMQFYLHIVSLHEGDSAIRAFPLSNRAAQEIGIDVSASRRYSLDELVGQQDRLRELIGQAQDRPETERSAIDLQILELARRVEAMNQLRNGHHSPWHMEADQIIAIGEYRADIDGTAIPRMVPPAEQGDQWRVLFPAAFDEFAATELNSEEFPRHPAAKTLCDLLAAYRDSDTTEFATQLAKHKTELSDLVVDDRALEFTPPVDWIESGISTPYELKMYSDGLTNGIPICRIDERGEGASATIIINHFPQQEVQVHTLVNSWRINAGLDPIEESRIDDELDESEVAGFPSRALRITTDEHLPIPAETTIVNVLHHDSGTWVISLYGPPKNVRNSIDEYESFLDSIQIGEGVESLLAVGKPAVVEPDYELGVLAGIIRGRKHDWVISAIATAELLDEHRELLVAFMKSFREIQQRATDTLSDAFEVDLPADWQSFDSTTFALDYYMPAGEFGYIRIRIHPIARLSESATTELVQHWRKGLFFEPLSPEEIMGQFEQEEAGGRSLRIIEFHGLPPSPKTIDDRP